MSTLTAQVNDDWSTQTTASLAAEYEIYLAFTDEYTPKTFEEWLES